MSHRSNGVEGGVALATTYIKKHPKAGMQTNLLHLLLVGSTLWRLAYADDSFKACYDASSLRLIVENGCLTFSECKALALKADRYPRPPSIPPSPAPTPPPFTATFPPEAYFPALPPF